MNSTRSTECQEKTQRQDVASQFLTILDEGAEDFTFQTFDDSGKGRSELARIIHGDIDDVFDQLVELNNKGAGVYVTVNETDGKGRKKDNIVRVRAIWQEDDRGGAPELPMEPHIVVQSSPGKHHRYTLTDTTNLDEFDAVEQRLVDDYGSDPNAKDITRVLRLPGFFHMKDPENPHLVTIVSQSNEQPIPWNKCKELFPPVERGKAGVPLISPGDGEIDRIAQVYSALYFLDPDMGYLDWLKVGMALHHGAGGGQDGLALWDEWSQRGSLYNEGECAYRWVTFGRSDFTEKRPPATVKKLFWMARQSGYEGQYLLRDGNDTDIQMIDLERRRLLERFNREYGVVLIEGQAVIAKGTLDSTREHNTQITFASKEAIKTLTDNQKIPFIGDKGVVIQRKIFDHWLQMQDRCTYENGVEFRPEPGKIANRKKYKKLPAVSKNGKLNLYTGLAITPRGGDCKPILGHIWEVWCSENKTEFDYIISWFARLLQKPDELGHTVPVLRSDEGAGKNIIIDMLVDAFGQHGLVIANMGDITGPFSDHLATSIFTFLNEAVWGGDKQGEGVLKALITDEKRIFNKKYVPTFTLNNYNHLLIASNNDWVAPVGVNDRRYFYLNVNGSKIGNFDYFKDLAAHICDGGKEAFLYHLLNLDISQFNPRHMPLNGNSTKLDNKIRTMDTVGQWWVAKLYDGQICDYHADGEKRTVLAALYDTWETVSIEIKKETLYHDYIDWCRQTKQRKPEHNSNFHRKLQEYFPASYTEYRPKSGDRKRVYDIPSLIECRPHIDKVLGGSVTWTED